MKRLIIIISLFVSIISLATVLLKTQMPEQIGIPPELQSFLFEKPKIEIPNDGRYIYKSASELVGMIKKGEATSEEIVREHISHIKNNNYKYNAIVWLREEEALEEAKHVDLAVRNGDTSGMLLGLPVTVKEQFMVKGFPSTLNAKRLGIIADEDAEVVKQIKREGAIIIGITNLSLMVSFNETWGEIYPTGNNPYDTALTPGGSTGGGAAALAAGFTTLSLGGDAGGSIRIPAAFCGVYGMKPSIGVINVTEGVMPFEIMRGDRFGIACAGPLARTIEDIELYWNVLKKTPIDKIVQNKINLKELENKKLNEYKIAWMDEWECNTGKMKVGKEVKDKLRIIIDNLENSGVNIKKDAPNIYDDMAKLWGGMLFQIITQDETWLVRKIIKMSITKQDNKRGNFDEIYKSLDDNSKERWNKLKENEEIVIGKLEKFFEDYDFLILPLTYGPAFKKTENATSLLDENGVSIPYVDYFPYTGIFNATGNPAIVIPMGLNKNGLPLSLQIVGPLYSDDKLIDFVKKIKPLVHGFIKPSTDNKNN